MSVGLGHVSFTWNDDPAQREPFMVCGRCGAKLCTIEENDSLSVIVSVATEHTCGEAE